jgi:hypothetical protein
VSRWISPDNETAAAETSVVIVVLVSLDFLPDVIRVHTGLGELQFDGETYYGIGQLGGIDCDSEDSEVAARGVRLTLSGIPSHLSPDILTVEDYQGRAATLYIGLVDRLTGAWIDDPEELWSGAMDYMDLEVSGTARVVLHVEDELRREPLQAYYTDEDQQLRYSGDRFFADLPNVQLYKATWGQKPSQFTSPTPGGGWGDHTFPYPPRRP